jgi:two-component sensor histidine kinase
LWRAGRKAEIHKQKGWKFILAGFSLILFGMAIDITDNFPSLNKFILIGDTVYEAILEKAVGFLLGFLLLAIGFWRWIPIVVLLKETELTLKKAHDELELKVKERTINLQRELHERMRVEEALKKSLEDKNMLVKEIHHRVKNNLQVIQSLLSLQSGKVMDEKTKGYFKESESRVMSMGMIHERLYQTDGLSRINFGEYIRSLTMQLFRNYNTSGTLINLSTKVPDLYLDIETVIPCGLIINELITNACKYAFPDNSSGSLCVELIEGVDMDYTLIVRDNGVGISDEVDIYTSKSIGMQLVVALTSQLNGSLKLIKTNGTEFRISFNKAPFNVETGTNKG